MYPSLKKLADQVIVITGASSGIGLATARRAAARGAKVVAAARNGEALERLTQELTARGAQAIDVVADVGDAQQVRAIADAAIERFGGFDTWVNNAGISIYGRIEDIPLEDQRRLFDTNFWGVVHGSRVAVEHFMARSGALINVGSEVSHVAIPLQAIYAASKHAVKAFTDALRMELEHVSAPVSVTLVKPASVDTLFTRHAKNYMNVEPRLPPPVYAPEVVADAILHAAEHPQRDIFVGAASRFMASMAHYVPRAMDRYLEATMFRLQRSREPARDREQNGLHAPTLSAADELHERQGHAGRVFESSAYTQASLHPKTTTAVLLGAGLALALWQGRRQAARV